MVKTNYGIIRVLIYHNHLWCFAFIGYFVFSWKRFLLYFRRRFICLRFLNSFTQNIHSYIFPNLVKFFNISFLIEWELLWSFSLSNFDDDVFYLFSIHRMTIEFFNRLDRDGLIVLKSAKFIFLLNTTFIIIDEHIISVVKVIISICFLPFFGNFTRFVNVSLFEYFSLEFRSNTVEMRLFHVI